MSEPRQPEDPIWSRWRQRHGQGTGGGGNGAPPRETPPEAPPEPERIRIGDPLPPDWAQGAESRERPHAEPPPREEARTHQEEAHARQEEARTRHHADHTEHECLEWCPICRTAEIVRASFPPEVRSQLEDVQRDALVAIRAVLDHYIQRLDADERPASRVEDIPIR